MNEYFNKLNNLPTNKIIKDMRKFAETYKVPVINDEALTLMLQLIDLIKPKRFLEIGTAIGYCAINIAIHNHEVIIDTIEKSEEIFNQALNNVRISKLSNRINLYLADALDFDLTKIPHKYDMIFIDGAKAQYIKFFERFEPYLQNDGIIISDNLLFHGLVTQPAKIENKNLRSLVEKIQLYNIWLSKHKNYHTNFLAIGDGIAISKRIKK